MLKELIEKKDAILGTFRQAKSELETLSAQIDEEMQKNDEAIRAIQQEQNGLTTLKQSSKASIKNLTKILGDE